MAKVPRPKKQRKGTPPTAQQAPNNLDKSDSKGPKPLNFKVSETFHREFKTCAAKLGVSMLDLLTEAFELVKKQRGL